MNHRNCNTCAFMEHEFTHIHPDGTILEKTGTCHRYPPILIALNPKDYEDNYESPNWLHPAVNLIPDLSDWCGEYLHKPDK